MGEIGARRRDPFWRAGEKPVRPVRAFRKTDEEERSNREVRKVAVKEKRGAEERKIDMPTRTRREYTQEDKQKGKKAGTKEKYKAYQQAVESEREMERDGEQRESRNTGGTSSSRSISSTHCGYRKVIAKIHYRKRRRLHLSACSIKEQYIQENCRLTRRDRI